MGHYELCATPGTKWGTEITDRRITLTIDFPLPVLADISDANKRKASMMTRTTEERRSHLKRLLHNALLPVVEGIYQERWAQFAGKKVERLGEPLPATWAELFK